MGARSDEIAEHIEIERRDLGRNVDELEAKVKNTFDWRSQVRERPFSMVGIAFGGGLFLSALSGGSRRHSASRHLGYTQTGSEQSPPVRYQTRKASETLENIKGALIGVVAAGLKSFLQDAIPGFGEQYRQTEQRAHSAAGATATQSAEL